MENVLCIDHSSLIQRLVRDAAESTGVSVTACGTLSEARSRLRQSERPDLILVTQHLEDGTGLEFLDWVHSSSFREVPVILISADDTVELKERAFSRGASDCVSKRALAAGAITQLLAAAAVNAEVDRRLAHAAIAAIDDSVSARTYLRAQLDQHGYEIAGEFSSSDQLLESAGSFDVFIVDVVLDGASGISVIRRIRERVPDAVIIAVSSLDAAETIDAVLRAGADDYMSKPVDGARLVMRMRRAHETRQLYRALRASNAQLQRAATTDALTGLPNRGVINGRLQAALERYVDQEPIGLIMVMLDIDNFKKINDTWGHTAGDAILKETGERLEHVTGTFVAELGVEAIVGRFGGEEFALVATTGAAAAAHRTVEIIGERIRRVVADEPFISPDGSLVPVTVSVGGAVHEGVFGNTTESVIRRADEQLYEAKKAGRNCSRVAPEMTAKG